MDSMIRPPDTLEVARAILEESMRSMYRLTNSGQPIVPAWYVVTCPSCGERVEPRAQIVGGALKHAHVLPVDSEGRCTSCVLLLCEFCDGREGGCERCDWTGVAQ